MGLQHLFSLKKLYIMVLLIVAHTERSNKWDNSLLAYITQTSS